MTFITEKELVNTIKFSRNTIQKWRKLGLPFMKPVREIRYDLEKVTQWMTNNGKGTS